MDKLQNPVVSECACMKIRRSVWRLKASGLGNMVEKYTLDNFKAVAPWQKDMKDTAKRFIASNDWNWFFAGGQVGAGKSHICTAIITELLKKYPAHYMLWRDEVNRLKANLMDDAQYCRQMDKLKRIKVLYIDDFLKGAVGETVSPSEIRIAFELINYRYNNQELVTVLSSEKTIGELMGMDEATASRILERCGEFVLNISRDETKNQRLKRSTV